MLFIPEDSDVSVFFQLFAHCGFIDLKRGIRVGQIVRNSIGDLTNAAGSAVSKDIQDAKMQYDILVSKALCFPGTVQWVECHTAVVHRDEDVLTLGSVPESHVAAKPALDSPALIIVAARALFRIVLAALEAVHIELPHIVTNFVKAFDQFAVSHVFTSLAVFLSFRYNSHSSSGGGNSPAVSSVRGGSYLDLPIADRPARLLM